MFTIALSANQKPILPSLESRTPRGSRPIKMLVQNWDMVRHTEGQLTPQKYPSLSKISPPTPVKTRQRLHRRIPLILPLHPPYWIVTNGAVRRCWIRRGNQPVLVPEYLPLSPDMTKKPRKWIQIPAQDLAPLVTGILEIDFERTVHFRTSSVVSLLQHWGKTLKKSILERWEFGLSLFISNYSSFF